MPRAPRRAGRSLQAAILPILLRRRTILRRRMSMIIGTVLHRRKGNDPESEQTEKTGARRKFPPRACVWVLFLFGRAEISRRIDFSV